MTGTVYIPTFTGLLTAQLSHHSTPRYLFHWNDPPRGAHTLQALTSIQNTKMLLPSVGTNDKNRIEPRSTTNTKSKPGSKTNRKEKLKQHESIARKPLAQDVTPKSATRTTVVPRYIRKTTGRTSKRSKPLVRPPNQPTLFDLKLTTQLPPQSQDGDTATWGHTADTIDRDEVFRVMLQNPRGLKLGGDQINSQYSLAICQSMAAGAICLPETNTNWGHRTSHKLFSTILRKTWKHTSYSVSHTKEEFEGINQPGGTANIVADKWTSRVLDKGTDPFGLGRWSYITLRGAAKKKVIVVTAYRVSQKSVKSVGPTTSAAQQFRKLSQQFRDSGIQKEPCPRNQFILDLQAWLEHKLQEQYDIILSLDANESITQETGTISPLTYNPEQPTAGYGHDGSLMTLIRTCGLCDPLTIQHPDRTPPTTYSRGPNRIDYILVSSNILPAVKRSGMLPFDSIFISDHRPCFVDFAASTLFKDVTPDIAPAKRRGLQLQDPRIASKYLLHLSKQLEYHKIEEKVQDLHSLALQDPTNPSIITQYNQVDQLMTESMKYAEKESSRTFSTTFQWSPTLAKAIKSVRYWRLKLKQSKGVITSQFTLTKAREEAKILDGPQLTTPEIVQKLRDSMVTLRELQSRHQALREQHLETLAAARVEAKCKSLSPDKTNKATAKEIRRILRNERISRSHRAIRKILKPMTCSGGLSKVELPSVPENTNPPDPKTWEGPWKIVTDPDHIASAVCAVNSAQYHQANDTPFATEPLRSHYGLNGDGPGTEDMLHGTLPPAEILDALLPETRAILQTLANTSRADNLDTSISPDKFKNLYKIIPEKVSSSPSGRHIGHYKAIASDDKLAAIWASMMSIPHVAGFTPSRWKEVVDVMLEKVPGNSKIHRLRIVALQESDFNQSNRLAFGRPIMHHLEDKGSLPKMQHGSRPAKLCISAVLNKQLQFEIQRMRKQPIAYIENDAIGCYDRIANPLVILFLLKLGVPNLTVQSLANTWSETVHKIKTLYGTSSESYKNTPAYFLFGPGQGSTIGPLLWLICFTLITNSLSKQTPSIRLRSVDKTITFTSHGDAFVDDTGLGCNLEYPAGSDVQLIHRSREHLVGNLQNLAQQWERLLFSTGGALNLNKCFWFSLSWTWRDGKPILNTSASFPAKLQLTAGYSTNPVVIQRIEPTTAYRTLGVHITPSGSNEGAYAQLLETVLNYGQAIIGSHLSCEESVMSYVQHLFPKLRFQLPALSLSTAACDRLMSLILKAALPKMHINRNTARSIVHGPVILGGMALPHIQTVQGIDKLHLFLGHLRLNDDTGKLIQIDLTYIQLITGSAAFFLNKDISDYHWIERGWVTSLWQFTVAASLTFDFPGIWLPRVYRAGDVFLMDYFISQKLSQHDLKKLNECRLFLQVITLSDIASADGRYIVPEVKAGSKIQFRESILTWPTQGRPGPASWRLWRQSLSYLEERGRLITPLGPWISQPHQQWKTYMDLRTDTLVIRSDDATERYPPRAPPSRRITRLSVRPLYDLSQSHRGECFQHSQLVAATIENPYSDSNSLVHANTSDTAFPVPTLPEDPPPTTFFHHIRKLVDQKHLVAIREASQLGRLVITTDGSYDPVTRRASYSWVFDGTGHICKASSQISTANNNAYRAELHGILAALLTLQWMEETHPGDGTATLYTDCQKAIKNSLKQGPLGIKDATQDEYDIILAIRTIRHQLRTKLMPMWTPGHQETANCRGEQVRNAHAHALAVRRLHSPVASPYDDNYVAHQIITAYYNSNPITSGLPQQVTSNIHYLPLKRKILRDTKWSEETFNSVDWAAHHSALLLLPRTRRLAVSKLIHGLWNVNRQNAIYYQESSACPYCPDTETMEHLFCCPSAPAVATRTDAIRTLGSTLKTISTPEVLSAGIISLIHPPAIANLDPARETIATQEVVEAQSELGWDQLFRGRLSTAWRTAYLRTIPSTTKRRESVAATWVKKLIIALWDYSFTIWQARNDMVHGQTETAKESKALKATRQEAKRLFLAYDNDPYLVPSSRAHLFDKPLLVLLQLPITPLRCWVISVQEAIKTRQYREEEQQRRQKEHFKRFFIRKLSPVPAMPTKRQPRSHQQNNQTPTSTTQQKSSRTRSQNIDHSPSRQRKQSKTPPKNSDAGTIQQAKPKSFQPTQVLPTKDRTNTPTPSNEVGSGRAPLKRSPSRPTKTNRLRNILQHKNQDDPKSLPRRRRAYTKIRRPPPPVIYRNSLLSFGFTIRLRSIGKRQASEESIKRDYSGSLVSTTP